MLFKLTKRRIVFAIIAMPAVVVIAIVIGGWFYLSYNSFEAHFARSKRELEAYASVAMASSPNAPLPALHKPLGDFNAVDPERLPRGFLFFCDYGHPLDQNGIAYSTEPLPYNCNGRDYFTHIEGNWYRVDRSH